MRTRRFGNSIVEYGLPIVAMVGIFAFALNPDIPSLFQNLFSNTLKGNVSGETLEVSSQGILTLDQIPKELQEEYLRSNGKTFSKGDSLCIQGSFCVQVPNVAGGSVVEVDGGLGGTTVNKLAALLEELEAKLKAAGYPDSFVNKIRDLANKGHDIGNGLKEFEAYQSGIQCDGRRGKTDCNYQTLSNDPGTVHSRREAIYDSRDEFIALRGDLNAFLAANPGLLKDVPEAKVLIDMASDNIIQGSAQARDCFMVNGVEMCDTYKPGPKGGANGIISVNRGSFVKTNANTICKAGAAGDGCIQLVD